MNDGSYTSVPERSAFVTILGWICILLAGFSILGLTIQIIFLSFIFQNAEIFQGLREQIDNGVMPALTGSMFLHFRLFSFCSLIAAFTTLIAAIGLLMRINWARILFIVILSLAIAWQIFGFISQWFIMPEIPVADPSVGPSLRFVIMTVRILSFFTIAGMCFLFGWIIKKLTSEKIRKEFLPEVQANPSLKS